MVDANNTAHSHEFAESVINTVREPLIALDQDLRVVAASRSFYQFFKVKPEETVGQLIYDLGNKQWDMQFIQKPFSANDLRAKVHEVLKSDKENSS